jgi:hypothetical protein
VSPFADTEKWQLVEDADAFGDYCPEHIPAAYIHIQREDNDNLVLGPYRTLADAEHAAEHALLVDGICEEDALEVFANNDLPEEDEEHIIIDLNDPHHTGVDA